MLRPPISASPLPLRAPRLGLTAHPITLEPRPGRCALPARREEMAACKAARLRVFTTADGGPLGSAALRGETRRLAAIHLSSLSLVPVLAPGVTLTPDTLSATHPALR